MIWNQVILHNTLRSRYGHTFRPRCRPPSACLETNHKYIRLFSQLVEEKKVGMVSPRRSRRSRRLRKAETNVTQGWWHRSRQVRSDHDTCFVSIRLNQEVILHFPSFVSFVTFVVNPTVSAVYALASWGTRCNAACPVFGHSHSTFQEMNRSCKRQSNSPDRSAPPEKRQGNLAAKGIPPAGRDYQTPTKCA